MSSLLERARRSRFDGYAYAYPHKTAYRRLEPAPSLAEVWAEEPTDALFLYVHVPFCEMRCGFCNLFTQTGLEEGLERRYVDALERQAEAFVEAVGRPLGFARLAVGGGTPTLLEPSSLARIFALARGLGADARSLPTSVEASPGTIDEARLAVLREAGVTRLSLGVQSFVPDELRALGRAEDAGLAHAALRAIRAAGFPLRNVDLIYGTPGQTEASFLESLRATLEHAPEEIFLYPLYVRPLTGLGRRGLDLLDVRARLYDVGCELLLRHGYAQETMRLFRRTDAPRIDGPRYACQEDGMVGLGAGARSYTRTLHHSFDYAVSRSAVKAIIADYVERPREAFGRAEVGFVLDEDESRRRHVIQSLLSHEGLDRGAYASRFGDDPFDRHPELAELLAIGWAALAGETLRLARDGYAHSDVIGPALYSERVRALSEEYELR